MSAERESWSPSPVNRGDVKGCGIKIRKPQVCLWFLRKDVTLCDLEKLERAQSNEDVRRALSEVLGVRSGPCDVRASALLDLHYYTLRFCWDCGFSAEQTSCVFSIVKEIHAACVGSTLGDVTECYRHCQQLLLCHAVSRPPFSINLFSPQELLHIRDYILNTYFRHFKLYKCVFSSQLRLDISLSYNGMSETEDPKTSDEAKEQTDVYPGEETSGRD
ncbi:cilia- and flagella-associated protein 119 isoform X4 [Eleutherodactylus coqui]|uniref:cilia- and flagella-associated protein 119 isoform X4 n=1 Tax=Eleutherodactylus coqui TaxID=57060 RepID=UPI00346238B7